MTERRTSEYSEESRCRNSAKQCLTISWIKYLLIRVDASCDQLTKVSRFILAEFQIVWRLYVAVQHNFRNSVEVLAESFVGQMRNYVYPRHLACSNLSKGIVASLYKAASLDASYISRSASCKASRVPCGVVRN